MPTFDKLVFDIGVFDGAYALPLFARIGVAREALKVKAGQAVPIEIRVQAQVPNGSRYSLNTATLPTIRIYNPNGTVLVTTQNMVNSGEVGSYTYQHQTIGGATIGAYTADFIAINGDMTLSTDKLVVFEVVA